MSKDKRRIKRDFNRLIKDLHYANKTPSCLFHPAFVCVKKYIRYKAYMTERNCVNFFGWF